MKHATRLSVFGIVFTVAIVSVVAEGCGGKMLIDETIEGGAAQPGTGAGGPGGGSGGGPVGGPTGVGGGSGGSGGGVSGGGGTALDAGLAFDATTGGGIANGHIACGATKCEVATQDCCVAIGGGGAGGATCSPKGQCQGVPLSCSSASNCAGGEVCCATFGAGTGGANCQPTCGGGGGGGGGGFGGAIQLCANDKECRNGQSCRATPFGFKACLGKRMPPGGPDAG